MKNNVYSNALGRHQQGLMCNHSAKSNELTNMQFNSIVMR